MKKSVLLSCFILTLASAYEMHYVVGSEAVTADNTSFEGSDILITEAGTLTISGEHSFHNVHIMSGGLLTHPAGDAPENKIDLILSGSLTIDAGGAINVNGRGYPNQQGPGAGTGIRSDSNGGGGGGAYGGNGGMPQSTYNGGTAYGSLYEPVELGSGGGNGYAGSGGSGGGRVKIVATDVILNGTITANGDNGPSHSWGAAGGGSGGSVWLQCSSIQGTGTVTANGGNGSEVNEEDGGGGAGGRIAVYFENESYTGDVSATGGTSAAGRCGGAGTVYSRYMAEDHGDLFVGNEMRNGAMTPLSAALPYNLEVASMAVVGFVNEGALIRSLGIRDYGAVKNLAGQSDAFLEVERDVSLTDNSLILANISLSVGAGMLIDPSCAVKADYLGYAGSQGPGAGTGHRFDVNGGGGGGAYGGDGGKPGSIFAGGIAYGSITDPNDLGSGGGQGYAGTGGSGGGRLLVHIAGILENNGIISANGAGGISHSYGGSGGGSGGSVRIECSGLSGAGIIRANGGAGTDVYEEDGGAGGGGRIAVYYSDEFTFTGLVEAVGGASSAGRHGGAGTIFLKNNNQPYGAVYMANNDLAGTRSNIDTDDVFDLYLAAGATPAIAAPLTLNSLMLNYGSLVTHTAESKDIDITVHGDLTISGGGAIWANQQLNVLGNVSVLTGAEIKADAKGYAGGQGSGAGTGTSYDVNGGGGGGAYGGDGGAPQSIYKGGTGYGLILTPDELGSGGGTGHAGAGGTGGGSIRMTVGGVFHNDGAVSSNGAGGQFHNFGGSGGGSGGSIWIDAASYEGDGVFRANGGSGTAVYEEDGGSGGGGRIAVYGEITAFYGAFEAFAGAGTAGCIGGAGTVAIDLPGSSYKLVTVSNNSLSENLTRLETAELYSLFVKDGGKAAPAAKVLLDSITVAEGGFITNPPETNDFDMQLTGDMRILAGGQILGCPSIDVAGSLTVDAGGVISASGKGFPNQQGPGAGTGTRNDSGGGGGGAGYGNYGGNPQSPYHGGAPYGSEYCPVDYGSGGGDGFGGNGGAGGGAIKINAGAFLTNNGEITARGNDGAYHYWGSAGGGSGGSIWLTANVITGAGLISANGGNGFIVSEEDGGGGAGGRIALYSFSGMSFPLDNVSVFGGSGYQYGGEGTMYINNASTGGSFFVLDETTPSGTLAGYADHIDISFSVPVNDATFTIADVVLIGPGVLIAAENVIPLTSDTGRAFYRITFPKQKAEGTYHLEIYPNITSTLGASLDQNHNGTGGETEDLYVHEFTVDYIGTGELMEMAGAWLTESGAEGYLAEYDSNSDGIIDFEDFAAFAATWYKG